MTKRYTFADLAALGNLKRPESISHDEALPSEPGRKELRLKLSKDCEVRMIFAGEVTQEAIIKLCALLGLSKDSYPTEAQLDEALKLRQPGSDEPSSV